MGSPFFNGNALGHGASGVGQTQGVGIIGTPEQDRAKLEKKRERNRIAATKCRQRKLEKISSLGEQPTLNRCNSRNRVKTSPAQVGSVISKTKEIGYKISQIYVGKEGLQSFLYSGN